MMRCDAMGLVRRASRSEELGLTRAPSAPAAGGTATPHQVAAGRPRHRNGLGRAPVARACLKLACWCALC